MEKVSVIVPTYNYCHYIEKAIDSLLNQTHENIDIIVVDDGSKDRTKDVLQSKYSGKIRYVYQHHKGASAARNRGIMEAKGKYILFLDADDWLDKRCIERKVSVLENNVDIDWVYSDWYYVDESGKYLELASRRLFFGYRKLDGDIFLDLLFNGNFIAMDSVLLRKACIEKIGNFDETLQALQDYELWLRLSRTSEVKYIDEPLTYVRMHSLSISKSKTKRIMAFKRLMEKLENELNYMIKEYKNIDKAWKKQLSANYAHIARMEYESRNFRSSLKYVKKSINLNIFQNEASVVLIKLIILWAIRYVKHRFIHNHS